MPFPEREQGSQWTKPWANKLFTSVDGYKYTGGNIMQLAFEPYDRYVWGTYKQWAKHECQVSKGEKSTKLLFFKKYFKEQDKGRVEVNGKVGNIYRYLSHIILSSYALFKGIYPPQL